PGTAAGTLAGGSLCQINPTAGGPAVIAPVALAGCPKADTLEIYGALGWKWLSVKYSYGLLNDNFGMPESNEWYLDFSASYPVGETGVTLGAHYGIQRYDGTIPGTLLSYDDMMSYDDYRISIAYDLGKASKLFSGAEIGAMYTGTSGANVCGYGSTTQLGSLGGFACSGIYPKEIADDQFTVWFKKTF
ncbi:MAG TPA: TorF family putative porin, partial [Burkholderiales bacterium]